MTLACMYKAVSMITKLARSSPYLCPPPPPPHLPPPSRSTLILTLALDTTINVVGQGTQSPKTREVSCCQCCPLSLLTCIKVARCQICLMSLLLIVNLVQSYCCQGRCCSLPTLPNANIAQCLSCQMPILLNVYVVKYQCYPHVLPGVILPSDNIAQCQC